MSDAEDDRVLYDEPEPQSNIVDLQEFKGRQIKKSDLSDFYFADLFIRKFRNRFVYVQKDRTWYYYEGNQWREDERYRAQQACKQLIREEVDRLARRKEDEERSREFPPGSHQAMPLATAARVAQVQADMQKLKANVLTTKKLDNVLQSVQYDPDMNLDVDAWDGEHSLQFLNTPEGVYELDDRGYRRREHRPSDYVRKMTAKSPDFLMRTPHWRKFLRDVTGGDKDLENFLQRMCGYILTGESKEQAMFFIHGPGQTGKSTFLSTIEELLGSYAVATDTSTLTLKKFETQGASPELAALAGARLVTASETREGSKWDVARIKKLTGNDIIPCRRLYRDPINFTMNAKIVVVGNAYPSLSLVDGAIMRRIKIIPFIHKAEIVDKYLTDKLRKEGAGILAWMLEGYKKWRVEGLGLPKVAQAATDDYFAQENDIEQWFKECCEHDPLGMATNEQVEKSYNLFCAEEGVLQRKTIKTLAKHLRENAGAFKILPFRKTIDGKTRRGFEGMRVVNLQGKSKEQTDG